MTNIGNGLLYIDDCLSVMKTIPDKHINLTVTSPPYNMNLRIRNGKYCSRQIVKELTTKYKNYSDNLPMEDYYKFNENIITELLRISKLSFYNVQFLTGNKQALFKLIGTFSKNIKEIIIWDKINAEPAIGVGILNSRFEVLLALSEEENAISRKFSTGTFGRGELQNLWQIKRGKKTDKSHGAVFPEELVEKIITNFSSDGDIIFDPFSGSGTTATMAEKHNRKWIACEIDSDYATKSIDRILSINNK